jgi:hypothetical protein
MFTVSGGEPDTVNDVWATQYPWAHADKLPVLKLYWLEVIWNAPDELVVTASVVEIFATYTVAPAMGNPVERSEITPWTSTPDFGTRAILAVTGMTPVEPGRDTFEVAERYPVATADTPAENGGEELGLSKKFELSNKYVPEEFVVVFMFSKNDSPPVSVTAAPGTGAPVVWFETTPRTTVPPGFSVMFTVRGGEPETVNDVWPTQYPFAHADRLPVLKPHWLEVIWYAPDEFAVTESVTVTCITLSNVAR